MTEQAFFLLTALVDGPLHGYGILGEVESLSGGRIQLKVGTLYGLLDRLTGEGLIEPAREEIHQGRRRRYYRLTERGRFDLAAEAERLAANARLAVGRLDAAGRPAVDGGAS